MNGIVGWMSFIVMIVAWSAWTWERRKYAKVRRAADGLLAVLIPRARKAVEVYLRAIGEEVPDWTDKPVEATERQAGPEGEAAQ